MPILIIWFGVGSVPAIITAFMLSFFPILVNVATGIATVEPELLDVLRALGASRWQVIRKVGLPRSMPYFFASLKVAITVAFIGSIVAETVGGNKGIGSFMLVASSRFEVAVGLRRASGHQRHGHFDVCRHEHGGAADDRLGDAGAEWRHLGRGRLNAEIADGA